MKKRERGAILIIFSVSLLFIFFLMTRVDAITYNCNSCGSCTAYLTNSTSVAGDIIQLSTPITSGAGTCIDFGGKKGVTFDCQSFSNFIQGPGNGGSLNFGINMNVSLGGSNNDTIKNCNISNFYYGIKEFSNSNNDTFSNLNLSSNNVGLIMNSAPNNNFLNLFLYNNSDKGLYISGFPAFANVVNGIIAYSNNYGVYSDTDNSTVYNNITATFNRADGIHTQSGNNISITNSISANNSVNGLLLMSTGTKVTNLTIQENGQLDIWYNGDCISNITNVTGSGNRQIVLYNLTNSVLQNQIYSELMICNATNSTFNNITVRGSNSLKNNYLAIFMTSNVTFTNINSSNNYDGMWFQGASFNSSTNDTFINITLNSNQNYGAYLYDINNVNFSNIVANNNLNDNIHAGDYFDYNNINNLSSSNSGSADLYLSFNIYNDTFTNSSLSGGLFGLYNYMGWNNTFDHVNVTGTSSAGIYFLDSVTQDIFRNSYITGNNYGIYFQNQSTDTSTGNIFYNNYISNTNNYFTALASSNFFNTTLTTKTNIIGGNNLGGNLWANPGGSGFSQTCADTADSNGICDSAYNIDGMNYDYLPFALVTGQSAVVVSNSTGSSGNNNGGGVSPIPEPIKGAVTTIVSSISSFSTSAGVPTSVDVSSSTMGITQLTITTSQSVSNAQVIVSQVPIDSFQIAAGGQTYQSFQITTTGLSDSNIDNVSINFQVNNSWISGNNLDAANISLYRNSNGTWTALPTTLSSQDSQYYYFSALSPGFSNYTILAQTIECVNGNTRCLLNDSQVCSSNVWILSQHCQLGCGNGKCITTTKEAENFFQNLLNNLEGFVNGLPGSLQLSIGTVTYSILIIVILSGVVIVSTTLVRTTRKRFSKK